MANRVPSRRKHAKPGTGGHGRYFHIEVRPPGSFVAFRVQDVGGAGGVERVAGMRANGTWDTQKWLIEKTHAHLEDGKLVPDTAEARKLLDGLGSSPRHLEGDRFRARPRRDIPESEKPTPAMKRAQQQNIKKAQAARRRTRKSPAASAKGSKARARPATRGTRPARRPR